MHAFHISFWIIYFIYLNLSIVLFFPPFYSQHHSLSTYTFYDKNGRRIQISNVLARNWGICGECAYNCVVTYLYMLDNFDKCSFLLDLLGHCCVPQWVGHSIKSVKVYFKNHFSINLAHVQNQVPVGAHHVVKVSKLCLGILCGRE